MSKTLKSLLLSVDKFDVVPNKGLLELKITEDEVPFSARVISEGTLRILGLLAITNPFSNTTVVGYEEPENGVHPRRLKLITDLLKNFVEYADIQVILNTHSPVFPIYFNSDQIVVCRKQGNETEFTPFKTIGQIFQRQEIDEALEGDEELTSYEITTLIERIVRGDFGG